MRQAKQEEKEAEIQHKQKFVKPRIEELIISPSKERRARGAWCACAGCGFGCACSAT